MKVTCAYCDSFVEATENLCCPCCGAPLGETIEAERARLNEQAEKTCAHERAIAEEETKQAVISAVSSVASAAVGSMLGHGLSRLIGGALRGSRPMPPRGFGRGRKF